MKWIKKDEYYIESEDGKYTIAKLLKSRLNKTLYWYLLYKGKLLIASAGTAKELMERVK